MIRKRYTVKWGTHYATIAADSYQDFRRQFRNLYGYYPYGSEFSITVEG